MTLAGRYRLGALLGEGSYGEVYQADDLERGERVALKLLKRARPAAIARFKREFRALRDLVHPNLIALHELGEADGAWFYTMELVDGVDLTTWLGGGVRLRPTLSSGASVDERGPAPLAALAPARVAAALVQLADALELVHGHGRLHCDLKPGNLLVDRGGRLRVCDFGLVADVGQPGDGAGTAWFAAPEQLAGAPLAPAADWYAVGALLFEAVSGRLPFVGDAGAVRAAKQRDQAPAIATVAPAIAPALAALIDGLLAREPARRAGADAVRAAAAALAGGAAAEPAVAVRAREAPLFGRERELAILADAHARAAAGAVVVRVLGPSGIGKSALCRHFLAGLPATTWVLTGRCYQREQMPFRALDPLIDELAARLAALADDERAALVPPDAGALGRLFPVLRAITGPDASAPGEARRRGFAAARALFARLAARGPLVLWLDDLQWSDDGSGALLAEILRDRPPLLCLASGRSEDAAASPVLRALAEAGPGVVELAVPALAPAAGAALARALGGDDAAAIAEDAGGSPFLVRELALAGAGRRRDRVTVDDLVRDRAATLAPPCQALLAAIALAGRPIAEPIAIAAAGGAVGRGELAALRAAGLVRATAASRAGADELDTYHDRVREAVVHGLDGAVARALHAGLARALTAAGGDGEAIALHHRGAGDRPAARTAAAEAARAALAAGTAERAAALFALAAELADTDDDRRALALARGDALALAGQGGAAAAVFSAAAATAEPGQARVLRRRAAEMLLRAGHLDDGLDALAAVLREHGLRVPRTPRGAVASLVWQRARLAVRGTRVRERADPPAAELERIDALWVAATCLSMTDHLRGAELQVRQLRAALAGGDPTRIARALVLEAVYSATAGGRGRARSRALTARAALLAERTGDPLARALIPFAEGVCAHQAGEWTAARDRCRAAMDALIELPGTHYELANARFFWLEALIYLGELDAMIAATASFAEDAARRGDAYTLGFLRGGPPAFRWIWRGQLDRGLAEVRAVAATLPRGAFHVPHLIALLAEAQLLLAAGDGAAAWARLERDWRALEHSYLLRAQNVLVEMTALRGRAALADGRLPVARACAARVRRERTPWGDVLAGLLDAGLERSAERWRAAASAADACAMPLHAAAARIRAGESSAPALAPAVLAALAPRAP